MALRRNIRMTVAAAILAMAAFSGGCGGGAGSTSGSVSGSVPVAAQIFEWTPPATYFDNTPLNPQADLDHYEIYVSDSPVFTDNDAPVAAVAAVTVEANPDGRHVAKATNRFNLTHIAGLVEPGRVYYVSVRAVGTDNLVSSFSPPAEWDLG
jgi:hypothetical protein